MTFSAKLVEFLYARLSETEREALNYSRFELRDNVPGSYAIRDEILADVEAKRQVISRAVNLAGYVDATREDNVHTYEWVLGQILVPLAAPYANHPDYPKEVTHG